MGEWMDERTNEWPNQQTQPPLLLFPPLSSPSLPLSSPLLPSSPQIEKVAAGDVISFQLQRNLAIHNVVVNIGSKNMKFEVEPPPNHLNT